MFPLENLPQSDEIGLNDECPPPQHYIAGNLVFP